MSVLLAIHSYPGANETFARHLPFYRNSGADKIVGISTNGGECRFPEGIESVEIGNNEYICGPALPARLLDTFEWCLSTEHDHYIVAEYDVLFFKPIPPFTGFAAHRAGGKTFGSRPECFVHSPWCCDRPTASRIIYSGRQLIKEGACRQGRPECSPDVFISLACEMARVKIDHNVWKGFTRNSLDCQGDLEMARQHRVDGCHAMHGVKRESELEFIMA